MELGEVLTLQRGFDLPKRARTPGPYPVVSSSGTTGSHNEFKVAPPGVVIGRYGSLGRVHWVTEPFWPLNTSLWVKNFKGNDPRFVSYLLQTVSMDGSSAAAVPGVNRNHLHQLIVRRPSLRIQRRIAALLSALDESIEIHQRHIAGLVGTSQATYREWFVRMRYPGSNWGSDLRSDANTAPRGWRPCRIEDIVSALTRGISPRYEETGRWLVLNQRCVRDRRVTVSAARRHEGNVPEAKQVRRGDVLINSTGVGTLGRVGMVLDTCDSRTVDSHVTIVRPEASTMNPWFSMNMLSREGELRQMGAGSTGQTELARSAVGDLPIIVPSDDVLAKFADLVWPLLRQIPILERQGETLKRIRDLLLSRLVTGKLEISDVDLGILSPAEPD